MTNYEKYLIYQGHGKVRNLKTKILNKVGDKFQGLITIITIKTVYGHNKDYYSRNNYYTLDSGEWTKINLDTNFRLINENKLSYEHIDSDWISEGVLC